MLNPQKFNIINPKRGSSDALYERVDSVPMWRRCLRYRPRSKDLRAFNPLRDKIRQIPGCVQRICTPGPSGARGKHAVSSSGREVSKATATFIKAVRARGTRNNPLASNSVPRVHPISPKPVDPAPSRAFAKESNLNAAYGEPESARVYDINYNPRQSYTPLQPNHMIGMALTTTQTVLNYSNGHGDTHDKVQKKVIKKATRVSNPTARPLGLLQIDKGTTGIKPKDSDLIGLVDISALAPEYSYRPRRTPAVQKRATNTHEIQHHPLPHSASTHNSVPMLEVKASEQEQEKAVEATTRPGLYSQKSSTPRHLRRRGQVWDRVETGDSFRGDEVTKGFALDLGLS